jgi:hypothetical protein
MKALQTRSPIHLYYQDANLTTARIKLYVNTDRTAFDTQASADYSLTATAINNEVTVEIAELLRSKNDYLFESDFYTKRDTATYTLVETDLLDDIGDIIETQYNLLRIRDGYVERNEQIQLLNNLVSSNFNEWTLSSASLTEDVSDPFGGANAITIDNDPDGTTGYLQFDLDTSVATTVSVIARSSNSLVNLSTAEGSVSFSLLNENVNAQTAGLILSTDILDLGFEDMYLVSVVFSNIDSYIRISTDDAADSDIRLFAPNVIKGNWLNSDASDLVLQSNYVNYSTTDIDLQIGFDLKESNTSYNFGLFRLDTLFASDNTIQSGFTTVETNTLTYDQLDGTVTTQSITLDELCEPKYTPVKVSFINKFGVIQDLVFFKKRVDTVRTTKDSYKANILKNGQSLSHVGQKQILRKNSMRSVKISSGFYPEDFNTVFEQLLNSLNYWIDDEPAVLKSSSWTEKTSVNDKLISYDFEFEFANEDINNIR